MYGMNAIAKPRKDDFLVHSIFYTIQGEGPLAGRPAIFVRLGGCNLRCFWCDTDFDTTSSSIRSPRELASEISNMAVSHNCSLIVITGGEPMLQPLPLLVWAFEGMPGFDLRFQIETAGTVWPDDMTECLEGSDDPDFPHWGHRDEITIVTSPKTQKVHPMIAKYTSAWKYVIIAGQTHEEDGLPILSTQLAGRETRLYRPPGLIFQPQSEEEYFSPPQRDDIFVQPCDQDHFGRRNRDNMDATKMIALQFGYRLSLQIHKIAGLD